MGEANSATDFKVDLLTTLEDTKDEIDHNQTRRCVICDTNNVMVLFYTQVWFSSVTMSFCIYKLCATSDPSIISIYLPILSSIVTLWLPMPKMKTQK
jgi:hypothetical protein